MATEDRTHTAITRQLTALKAPSYEVGIGEQNPDGTKGKMMIRVWDTAQIIKSLKYLKYQNMQRSHIYVRPLYNQGYVMMDDATQGTIKQLKADGLKPACIVESSPYNFQVWLRISKEKLEPTVCTAIAQYLADKYDTDKAAADHRRFGRLAGFTNTKPKHVGKDGRYPFVLLSESKGVYMPEANALINAAVQWQDARHAANKITLDVKPLPKNADGVAFYKREYAVLYERYKNSKPDGYEASHGDWMIATSMVKRGFSADQIKDALIQASPDLESRKAGHIEHYVNLTVSQVMARFE